MTAAERQAERLEAAIDAGRELLRDLNSAGKDLRRTLRQVRQETRDLAATEVRTRLEAEVAAQIAVLATATEKQMDAAVTKVNTEFDKLGAILLGIDQDVPLQEMVRMVAAAPGRSRVRKVEASLDFDVDVLGVRGEQ